MHVIDVTLKQPDQHWLLNNQCASDLEGHGVKGVFAQSTDSGESIRQHHTNG